MRPAVVALCVGLGLEALALSACELEAPKTALGYTESAKRAYEQAMAAYKSKQYIDAQLSFREVKRRYSYSRYALLSELRIADIDFETEKFSDAIREYKDFIHAHRTEGDEVIYARAKIADATVAEIPESFLSAAAEERDQASVVDAYKELRSFLTDYPSAAQSDHARELLRQIVGRLVRHELYVARFYQSRGNNDAAVLRIQYALRTYSHETLAFARGEGDAGAAVDEGGTDATLEADALLLLGETYLRMQKWPEARQAFEAILQRHARTGIAVQAQNYLDHLRARGV
jgi:outer membrane protein assembly factor BamD